MRSLFLRITGLATLTVAAWAFDLITDESNIYVITWSPGNIPMVLKMPASGTLIDGNTYNSSIQAAMSTWNTKLGVVQFTSTVQSAGNGTAGNGISEITMASTADGEAFDSKTLAVTLSYYSLSTYFHGESDIVFNSAKSFDSYRGNLRTATDIQRVALHELGHVLGLDHPDEAGQSVTAVMNSTVSNVDTLQTDDITGAQYLYGAPGVSASNDNFANAVALTLASPGSVAVAGSNIAASRESGEPSHGSDRNGRSVWWKWTAPFSGAATVSTLGSNFDTLVGVYTGSAVNGLTTLATNDDEESAQQNSSDSRKRTSLVTFAVTSGTTYYIAVDGWNAYYGQITLYLAASNSSTAPAAPTTPPTITPVILAPVITTQPASLSVTTGGSATFNVVATGENLTYQWKFGGAAIAGATSSSYTISSVQASNAGSYTVDVTNGGGTTTSTAATLTVTAPVVVTPPSSGGGGGGGGGAPSDWFLGALAMVVCARAWSRFRQSKGGESP